MAFITREQWGARRPRNTTSLSPRSKGIVIHWLGPASGIAGKDHSYCDNAVRGIQNFHMDNRGWSDIAYNLLPCPHGHIFEGRGKGVRSAAQQGSGTGTPKADADDSRANYLYHAVCALVGEGDPQPEDLHKGIAASVALCRSWGAGSIVLGHRDFDDTTCPGSVIYGKINSGRYGKTSTSTSTKTSTSTLVVGLKGDIVAKLQAGLNRVFPSYSHLAVDGKYGPATAAVIAEFQRRSGLTQDGVVGPNTRAALVKYGIVL